MYLENILYNDSFDIDVVKDIAEKVYDKLELRRELLRKIKVDKTNLETTTWRL